MKHFLFPILILANFLRTNAQSSGEIVGITLGNPDYFFKTLDLSSQTDSILAPLGSRGNWQGNSTYDMINNIYYYRNGLYIYKVNAISGEILDSLSQLYGFNGIEYNETCDCLMGINMDLNTNDVSFASVDFNTKNLNIIAAVASDANYFGESTFDQANQRYFRARMGSVEVLDVLGNQVDLLPRPGAMQAFEYDETMDRLVGSYFSVSKLIITSVEIATKQILDLDSIQLTASLLSGESTFDQTNQRYFFRTTNEIYAYNFQSQTFETFADPLYTNITGMEFKGSSPIVTTAISENREERGLTVYPNPAEKDVFFQGLKEGSNLRVFNISGKCIYDKVCFNKDVYLSLKEVTPGIYIYEATYNGEIKRGKLLLR